MQTDSYGSVQGTVILGHGLGNGLVDQSFLGYSEGSPTVANGVCSEESAYRIAALECCAIHVTFPKHKSLRNE